MPDQDFSVDTSHFDECRTIMQQHKRNHMRRVILLFCISIFNGYLHIIPMPMLRAGDSLAEDAVFKTGEPAFIRYAIFGNGFGYAVFAFLLMIALLVLGLLATPEKPKLICLCILLTGIALLFKLMNSFCLLICLVLFLIALSESKKARWVMQQPGYPYFNERFEEQLEQAAMGYQPTHDITENEQEMGMPDLENAKDRCTFLTQKAEALPPELQEIKELAEKRWQELSPQETATDSGVIKDAPITAKAAPKSAPYTVSDIPDISDTPLAIPAAAPPKMDASIPPAAEPVSQMPKPFTEVPKPITEIPDPVWDIPDPVMDTSVITSDFPDIAGDIPDLPDIPDIPKL